mgnify:CR=1 FL=1
MSKETIIEAHEARIKELEERIKKLEAAHENPTDHQLYILKLILREDYEPTD